METSCGCDDACLCDFAFVRFVKIERPFLKIDKFDGLSCSFILNMFVYECPLNIVGIVF